MARQVRRNGGWGASPCPVLATRRGTLWSPALIRTLSLDPATPVVKDVTKKPLED